MSKQIHSPTLASVEDHSTNSATFSVEPLHTGYGMTLGNSFRRVLLSSISGAAVTAFKIEGTTHEFTTVPGVKEDVIDIMQNLKGLTFRILSGEKHTIRLTAKGKGSVTAKQISLNADVELVNPNHIIATLSDDRSKLVMDLTIELGRGYRTIEEVTAIKASDTIAIDAVFSPVLRVRYKVENTRVGQITNLDKLRITIDTDGSISPRDAFEEAAAILVNQYTALAGQTRVEVGTRPGTNEVADTTDSEANELSQLNTSIEDLSLSARTTNALINNEIYTLKDLFSLSDVDLRELKGFGNKALEEVKDKMTEMEL